MLNVRAVRRAVYRDQVKFIRRLAQQAQKAGVDVSEFGDFSWLLGKVPGPNWCRRLVVLMHAIIEEPAARSLERIVAIYDGQIIRIDGNFKLPRHVKKCRAGQKRRYQPVGRVIINATGTLGFMLRRSQLADEECGDTLSKLLADICKDRRGFAIAMAAAGSPIPNGGLPTAVAIDADATYKHRIRRELGLMFPEETVLLAEAGSDVSPADCVDLGDGQTRVIPVWKCVITGDVKHVSLNVQKEVLSSAVDARTFIADANDAIMRWSRPKASEEKVQLQPPSTHIYEGISMSAAERRLLVQLVSSRARAHTADGTETTAIRRFLEMPWCADHPAWCELFPGRGRPPRRTVERVAQKVGANLHPTMGGHGWDCREEFLTEVHSLRNWYRRAVSVDPTGLPREDMRSSTAVRCSVLRSEVVARLNRLRDPEVLRSLELWSLVAEGCRQRGIRTYTGTVPTESLWAHLQAVLAHSTQTTLREDLFHAMSSIVFHRFVFQRANRARFPRAAARDPLIADSLMALFSEFRQDPRSRTEFVQHWWLHARRA